MKDFETKVLEHLGEQRAVNTEVLRRLGSIETDAKGTVDALSRLKLTAVTKESVEWVEVASGVADYKVTKSTWAAKIAVIGGIAMFVVSAAWQLIKDNIFSK